MWKTLRISHILEFLITIKCGKIASYQHYIANNLHDNTYFDKIRHAASDYLLFQHKLSDYLLFLQ